MLHRLALPPYESVKYLDGKGNFAVSKYYKFPFSFFYTKKLEMVLSYLEPGKIYRDILDFGCGKAKILLPSLEKQSIVVTCVDDLSGVDKRRKYDVIICSSVLEFVELEKTIKTLRSMLSKTGFVVVASPKSNILTELYFKLINDRLKRHTEEEILSSLGQNLKVSGYKSWIGLYFSCKATLK